MGSWNRLWEPPAIQDWIVRPFSIMSLHIEKNAAIRASGQLDSSSLVAAELSSNSAKLSGVSLNSFSSMKQLDAYPAGREVVFVCTYGTISCSRSFYSDHDT